MLFEEVYKEMRRIIKKEKFENRYFRLGILAAYLIRVEDFQSHEGLFYGDQYNLEKLFKLAYLFRLDEELPTEEELLTEIGYLKEAFKGEKYVKSNGQMQEAYLITKGIIG